MKSQTSTFENKAGLKIFTRTWLPDEASKGIIIFTHGFNSHSAYFQWSAEQFTAQNYAVYALDQQGRGQSEGERFYTDNIYDAVADVDFVVDLAKNEHPNLPTFILGHSAGGVLACLYALEHQEKLSGLISESFAFKVPAPEFALAVLKGLSHIAPHLHTIKLKNEDFSRNPEAVAIMNNDPLIADESEPSKSMEQLVKADDRLEKEFPLITLPVFILHGTADKAAKPSGSQFFFDNAGSTDKTIKFYDGHYHDLLNDLDKEIVMTDIIDWVKKHS
ncbi:MAG: lysophospholipase [Ferruginibacter sp.]